MDDLLSSLFSGPITERLPAWALTVSFIMIILKYTGTLERMARLLASIVTFVKDKGALEAEREKWESEREAELEEVQVNAAVQAQAAKQLSDQRAQQQLYSILERSIDYLQTDFTAKLSDLVDSHTVLSRDISDMETVAAQAKESLSISHVRLDGLAGLISQIAHNFDELKPHLTQLSESSRGMRSTVSELEGAIGLLVEVITKDGKNG